MSRKYRPDEREWRRQQQQDWPRENQPSFGRDEDDYTWSSPDEDYGRRRERGMWEGGLGHHWGNETANWSRGTQSGRPGRQEDYGRQNRPGEEADWSRRYAGLGGRGWREGWDDAMHRGQGPYTGRGPRNYHRQDNRIEEDINERLTEHPMLDATDIEVSVQNGEVTLRGQVDSRQAKRLAEDIADSVFGVKEMNNQIKVRQKGWPETEFDREEKRKAG